MNAITGAVKVIHEVEELEKKLQQQYKHPLLAPPTILVAMIEGGSAMNMVPDSCKISLTRRMTPYENKEQAIQDYQDIIDKLAAEDPNFKADLEVWKGFRLPMDLNPEERIIKIMQKAYEKVTGNPLPVDGEEGGADAAFIVDATGIPMPCFGPGDITLCAALDEAVELDDLILAVKVYALSIYYALGKEE